MPISYDKGYVRQETERRSQSLVITRTKLRKCVYARFFFTRKKNNINPEVLNARYNKRNKYRAKSLEI